jgi:ABC-2 type transport system permease protein
MSIVRIKAIVKKELIQIWRDPLSLSMAFLMPVMLLFIFGYAITLDVDRVKTVVRDLDKSSLSREFIAEVVSSGYFTVVGGAGSDRDIAAWLDDGRARVAITLPHDFSDRIRTGREASVQIIVDGSDSNTATIALGYMAVITGTFGQRTKGVRIRPLVEPRIRVWYNTELKSRNYIIPGLIAVIMAVIAALLTSLTFAREWDRGTMEQLIATPVRKQELIIGKMIPYFLIGFVDMVFSVLLAVYIFGVPLKGSVILLFLFSSLFLFGGLGVGMLISIATKSQLVASQISVVATFLPAFLLSGFMFSISNMPVALQVITRFIPARYFVAIMKGIFMKGSTFDLLVREGVFLMLFGLAIFALASKILAKRIG